jgi:uncharacterized integral membrane protein
VNPFGVIIMAVLNLGAAGYEFFWHKNLPLAITYLCYAVASVCLCFLGKK